jgi:O-antigen ligase
MLAFKHLSEKAFVVISLFFFTGAIRGFISDENPLMNIVNIFIYTGGFIALILVGQQWKQVFAIAIKEKILWILLGITCTSVLWSDIPMFTLEHILPLLRVTVFGMYFAARFNFKEQLQLLALAFGMAALLSLIVCVAIPNYGVVGTGLIVSQEEIVHTGAWRGVYEHKTFLGSIMSLGSVILLLCGLSKYQYRWIIWPGFSLSIFLLLRSTTLAALLTLIISIALIYFCQLERKSFGLFITMLVSLVFIASSAVMALASNAETIFNSFGKEVTISGRTLVWPLLIDKIWQRPLFGYGYETFWEGGWEGEVADVWRGLMTGFEPPHAHNGLLEICLDIGFLGLTIFVIYFLLTCFRSFIWLHKNQMIEGLAPTILLIHIFILNLTESYFMRPDIYWLICVTITLSMYRNSDYKHYLIYLDRPFSSYSLE